MILIMIETSALTTDYLLLMAENINHDFTFFYFVVYVHTKLREAWFHTLNTLAFRIVDKI